MSATNLEALYVQARAGDKRARALMNGVKQRMRAGDAQATHTFNALSVIHFRRRSASEWATAGRLYDRLARKEDQVQSWAIRVRSLAEQGHKPAIRMYGMLRAIHMQRTTNDPETAGYNVRVRRMGFRPQTGADDGLDWAGLLSMMQAALMSDPGAIDLDQPPADASLVSTPSSAPKPVRLLGAAASRGTPAPTRAFGKVSIPGHVAAPETIASLTDAYNRLAAMHAPDSMRNAIARKIAARRAMGLP